MTEPIRANAADRPGPGTWILALALVLAAIGVFGEEYAESDTGPVPVSATPAAPVRVIVPSLDLRARVVPIEVDPDGVLFPPEDVEKVGWWKRSARPGSGTGQTLLTGHTVSTGGGVMDELGKLRAGDRVRVRTAKATVRYRVTGTKVYSRAQLMRHSKRLFSQDRDENRLVLITCTDWDGDYYQSNIVVFADPTGPSS